MMNNMSQGLGSFNNMMPQNNMMQQNPYGQQMGQQMGQQVRSPEMFSEQLMNPNQMMQPNMENQLQPMSEPEGFGVYGQSLSGFADGGAASSGGVPRETVIGGQPHMLAYINPEEEQMLYAAGGSGEPGPGGIPAFRGQGAADPRQFGDTSAARALYRQAGSGGNSASDEASDRAAQRIREANRAASAYVAPVVNTSYVDDTFGSGNIFSETSPGASTVNYGNAVTYNPTANDDSGPSAAQLAAEQLVAQQQAAIQQAAAVQKAADDKIAADKIAADKLAADQLAADQLAAEQQATALSQQSGVTTQGVGQGVGQGGNLTQAEKLAGYRDNTENTFKEYLANIFTPGDNLAYKNGQLVYEKDHKDYDPNNEFKAVSPEERNSFNLRVGMGNSSSNDNPGESNYANYGEARAASQGGIPGIPSILGGIGAYVGGIRPEDEAVGYGANGEQIFKSGNGYFYVIDRTTGLVRNVQGANDSSNSEESMQRQTEMMDNMTSGDDNPQLEMPVEQAVNNPVIDNPYSPTPLTRAGTGMGSNVGSFYDTGNTIVESSTNPFAGAPQGGGALTFEELMRLNQQQNRII